MKQPVITNALLCLLMGMLFLSGLRAQPLPESYQSQLERRMSDEVHRTLLRDYSRVKPFFEEAYRQYPSIPRGMLEAVSFTYSRFNDLSPADTLEWDTASLPPLYGVMGLTMHGKGVFRENLARVSALSGVPEKEILSSSRASILAYAQAFSRLQREYGFGGDTLCDLFPVLMELSELPLDETSVRALCLQGLSNWDLTRHPELYPMMSSLYVICLFLADSASSVLGAPLRNVDWEGLFGHNLKWLRKSSVTLERPADKGVGEIQSADYPDAVWRPAASCNYTSGRTQTPSNVTIHYTSGTYAGSIAWFQNCNARASAHYVIRSIDGQVTQMVREADKAWHVGSENGYTIGIEHEAYGDISSYFTTAMYHSSAALVSNICSRRPNINPLRTFYRDTLDDGTALNTGLHSQGGAASCVHIRGHQHYPNQTHTDPGPFWDWNYYYKLLNPVTTADYFFDTSGVFTDSGGPSANYGNDERRLTLIWVPGADSLVLDFSEFELEPDYDFMWIYEGNTPYAPKLGRWNTHSPGRVVARGEYMLVEFRSDCATTAAGWQASWHAFFPSGALADSLPPVTVIDWDESQWVTRDFAIHFRDSDDEAVRDRFYQIIEKENDRWSGDVSKGFLCDNFEGALDASVWTSDGHWSVSGNALRQPFETLSHTSVAATLNQSLSDAMLFDFYLTMMSGEQSLFFFGADGVDVHNPAFSGYVLLVDKPNHSVSLYKLTHGASILLASSGTLYFTYGQPYLIRVVWRLNDGEVLVFRHNTLILQANVPDGPSPMNGQYVGFATIRAAVSIDNVRSYISRADSVLLSVGADVSRDVRRQASAGAPACKIKSVVLDAAGHFSPLVEKSLKVDYTPPAPVVVHEMPLRSYAMEGKILYVWNASTDPHSGIRAYYYALMQGDGLAERLRWVSLGLGTSCSVMMPHWPCVSSRIVVRVENNAGLSAESVPIIVSAAIIKDCEATTGADRNVNVEIFDLAGHLVQKESVPSAKAVSLEGLPSGVYVVRGCSDGRPVFVYKYVNR